MSKRGFIAASLGAVLLTGLALAASAQIAGDPQGPPPAGMRHRGPGPGVGPMGGRGGPGLPGLRQLDLSDAQKDQVKAIMQSHRDEAQQVGERERNAHRDLELATESGNESDIRAKANALAAAIGDSAVLRAKVNAEILNVLTPDQQEKLKQFRGQREQRMQQMQQRMKGRGERGRSGAK